jgi:hypothetical protein
MLDELEFVGPGDVKPGFVDVGLVVPGFVGTGIVGLGLAEVGFVDVGLAEPFAASKVFSLFFASVTNLPFGNCVR